MVLLGCSEKENNEITFQIFKASTHDWETQHVSLKGNRKEKQHTDLTVEPNLYWQKKKKNHAHTTSIQVFRQIKSLFRSERYKLLNYSILNKQHICQIFVTSKKLSKESMFFSLKKLYLVSKKRKLL